LLVLLGVTIFCVSFVLSLLILKLSHLVESKLLAGAHENQQLRQQAELLTAQLVARNEAEFLRLTTPEAAWMPTYEHAENFSDDPIEDYIRAGDDSNVLIDLTEDNKLLGLDRD